MLLKFFVGYVNNMKPVITDLLACTVSLSICLFLALLCDVNGSITDPGKKKCGEISCSQLQYCADHERHCKPCEDICDPGSNNRQPDVCEIQCQDYQQHILTSSMERKYQKAITLSTVAIVVSCFVLVLFVGYLLSNHFIRKGFLQRFKKKKQMPDKFDVEASKNGYKADGLKLDMPSAQAQVPVLPRSASPSHCPVTPATTSTPLSRPRHPSEDATLEYAYDNPALAPSPVLDKDVPQEVPARKESSF